MSDLPPFALALKQRRSLNVRQSQGAPLPPPAPLPTDYQRPREENPASSRYNDIIRELQDQIDALKEENESLRAQVESEESLRTQLRTERAKSRKLAEQVENLERIVDTNAKIADGRQDTILRLRAEYSRLAEDYQRVLNTMSIPARPIDPPPYPRYQRDDFGFDDKVYRSPVQDKRSPPRNEGGFDSFGWDQPEPLPSRNGMPSPPRDFEPMSPPPPPPPDLPIENPSSRRAAIQDSISFGQPEDQPRVINTDGMTVGELRKRLDELQIERNEKNRIYSKSIPKGVNVSHARQKKEELAEELDALDRDISKIKLALRQRGLT